jgi:ABC-type phosphate/phosphonate transport system substrate-binding protein
MTKISDHVASSHESADRRHDTLTFLLDGNLGIPVEEKPWSDILSRAGITATPSSDLVRIDKMVANHEPDIAFIPSGDFHRLFAKGDHYYRGLAISTSKFTGNTTMRSLLVVRKDDPANALDDLSGAKYGYINKSCSSTYFPPAILLNRQGKKLEEFFQIIPVKPGPTWKGLVDAVVSKDVRATMVLEDVWKTFPKNADETKVIGEYAGSKGAVVLVREGLNEAICKTLLDALLAWAPAWQAVYGGFKPFYYADVHAWFHDLDQLPPDM